MRVCVCVCVAHSHRSLSLYLSLSPFDLTNGDDAIARVTYCCPLPLTLTIDLTHLPNSSLEYRFLFFFCQIRGQCAIITVLEASVLRASLSIIQRKSRKGASLFTCCSSCVFASNAGCQLVDKPVVRATPRDCGSVFPAISIYLSIPVTCNSSASRGSIQCCIQKLRVCTIR